jgi:CDP-glycerol glycerophosphotransferase
MIKRIINKIIPFIKPFRLAKILHIDNSILLSFITINLSKLYREEIDKKLIILGGSSGKAFIGNTKYLYHYLKENSDYKLFYFVKSRDLEKKLKHIGINCVYAYTLKAIKILRKCRYVFVTHGLTDVLPIRFSANTTFIDTWHGTLMKKYKNIYNSFEYSKWAKILRLKIENDEIFDYFITPSESKKNLEILKNKLLLPEDKILVTGYPRNDLFFSSDLNLSKSIKEKNKIPYEIEKIFLYAPTFRDIVLTAKFPLNNEELIELNELLKENNYLFLMKAHKSEQRIMFKSFSNVKIIKKDADIQELLYISDCLITDYSSVYTDFLLLNRPIIFFTYDYDYYRKRDRGLSYNLKKMAPGPLIFTGKELIDAIKNIDKIDKEFELKRKKMNDIFNKYQDGNSTKRLLKFLKIIN